MKFQNPSLNSVLNGRKDERTDERTSRKQYAPHFFKVGGIKNGVYRGIHYFLIFVLKHRLCVLVRTASVRWF